MIQPDQYVRSLLKRQPGERVIARGWVKTRRDSKNVHFIQLNDGSSPVDLQVVLDEGVVSPDVVAAITTGACISAEGDLVASPGKGQLVELKARAITVHGAGAGRVVPAAEEEAHARVAARDRASAPAVEHVRRGLPGPQRAGGAPSTSFSRSAASCTSTRRSSRRPTPRARAQMFQVTTLRSRASPSTSRRTSSASPRT